MSHYSARHHLAGSLRNRIEGALGEAFFLVSAVFYVGGMIAMLVNSASIAA